MRLFTKIFLCTIAVVTIALSVMGYLIISDSFNNAIEHENKRGFSEYQFTKYTLQSSMLAASIDDHLNMDTLNTTIQQSLSVGSSDTQTAVINVNNKAIIFSTFPDDYSYAKLADIDSKNLTYIRENRSDSYWLTITGELAQNGYTIQLIVSKNITPIFEETQKMLERFTTIFIIVLCISSLMMFTLSLLLSNPIKRLTRCTRSFAKGNYNERIINKSSDETGELSRSFNKMASTIQETIQRLELNAQQKEDFIANFAHELKTPLTSVIGYADMIYQNENLPRSEVKDAAMYIVNEGMRLEALSLKLMDLIVLNKHDFSFMEMRMDEVLQDVVNTLLPVMQKKGVNITVSAEPCYISIELDLFKTMGLNIIDNAIKADSKNISIQGKADEFSYGITIADDGRGIPNDKLSRVTEAFYMVDKSRSRSQHGAGLGLAIVSRIAELHGAKLDFYSKVDDGTTVTIKMPYNEDKR